MFWKEQAVFASLLRWIGKDVWNKTTERGGGPTPPAQYIFWVDDGGDSYSDDSGDDYIKI